MNPPPSPPPIPPAPTAPGTGMGRAKRLVVWVWGFEGKVCEWEGRRWEGEARGEENERVVGDVDVWDWELELRSSVPHGMDLRMLRG